MKSHTPYMTFVCLLICVFSWGSVFPIAKRVLEEMSGESLVFWRFTIAAVTLALYIVFTRQAWPKLSLAQYIVIALVGVIGVGGLNLALFNGLQHTSAANGALIMALSPLVTSIVNGLLQREWLSRQQVFSLVGGLAGVLLVITNGSVQQLLNFSFNQGDVMIAAGMLAWSGYTICSQRVGHWLPVLPFTLLSMIAASVSISVVGLGRGEFHPWLELMELSATAFSSVLYIGLFATVLGYLFWINGVKALGPAKASIFFNLVPVFAALTALAMGQAVTEIQLVGMLIVILALMLPMLVNLRAARGLVVKRC